MLAQLKPIIPGAEHWPRFLRNRSEQYEARLALLEVVESPSLFLRGMAGSRIPVAVAHGEGRAAFDSDGRRRQPRVSRCVTSMATAAPPTRYPANPNGSPDAIAGLTSRDGRATILMPHPERTLRAANYSWAPRDWARAIRRGCGCSATRGRGWVEAAPARRDDSIQEKGLAPEGPGLIHCAGRRGYLNLKFAVLTLPSLNFIRSWRQPTQVFSVFHT